MLNTPRKDRRLLQSSPAFLHQHALHQAQCVASMDFPNLEVLEMYPPKASTQTIHGLPKWARAQLATGSMQFRDADHLHHKMAFLQVMSLLL